MLEEDSKGRQSFWGDSMCKKRDPEFRISSQRLQCFRSFLAGADVDRIADFVDKYFSVAG